MVGDEVTDPRTGQTYVVVKDFANRGDGSDLLFVPQKAKPSQISKHIKHASRPRLPGAGRRVRPKPSQE